MTTAHATVNREVRRPARDRQLDVTACAAATQRRRTKGVARSSAETPSQRGPESAMWLIGTLAPRAPPKTEGMLEEPQDLVMRDSTPIE